MFIYVLKLSMIGGNKEYLSIYLSFAFDDNFALSNSCIFNVALDKAISIKHYVAIFQINSKTRRVDC